MKIRSIRVGDVVKLSVIHKDSLPNTISSKMGLFYLESIYRSVVKNIKNNIAYVAVEKNQIAGAIVATTDLNLFQLQIKKEMSFKDYLKIIQTILLLNVSPLEIVKRIRSENKLSKNYKKKYATIVILFTDKNYRKMGVATKLVNKTLRFYKKKVTHIYVDTLNANKPAIKLYESLGFKVQKNLDDSVLLLFQNKNAKTN